MNFALEPALGGGCAGNDCQSLRSKPTELGEVLDMSDLRAIVIALVFVLATQAQAAEKPAALAGKPDGSVQAHASRADAAKTPSAKLVKAAKQPAAACANPKALGVSRTVEIDTTNGPRFGLIQYKLNDILAPGEVVLTFDDGPLPAYTMKILKALDHHCTKATFFPVGKMAIAFPQTLKEVARRGHTIGSHTWTHRWKLRRASFVHAHREIEMGISAVRRALGKPIAPFFRFPFLSDQRAAMAHLSRRNVSVFSISIDSNDYRTKSGSRVVRTIMRQLKSNGKGIALFHDIQTSSARAMPAMLDRLKAAGYRIVHLTAKAPGTTLAAYDKLADQKYLAKHGTNAEQKLARRRLVWPKVGAAPKSTSRSPTAALHSVVKPGAFIAVTPGRRRGASGQSNPLAPATPGSSPGKDWREQAFEPD